MKVSAVDLENRLMAAIGLDPADHYERIVIDIRPQSFPRVIVQRALVNVPDVAEFMDALVALGEVAVSATALASAGPMMDSAVKARAYDLGMIDNDARDWKE